MVHATQYSGWRKQGKLNSNRAHHAKEMMYAAKGKRGTSESNEANLKMSMVYTALGPH